MLFGGKIGTFKFHSRTNYATSRCLNIIFIHDVAFVRIPLTKFRHQKSIPESVFGHNHVFFVARVAP
jgi:hypothetical protein